MRSFQVFAAALVLSLSSSLVFPQSLADIARKEEERRKTIKTPSKVYTNDNLKRDPAGSTPAAAPAPGAASTGGTATGGTATPAAPDKPAATTPPAGEQAKPQGEVRDQAYWKNRVKGEQDQLDRSKTLLDAMQSRINALTTDFTNMSDPAQRAVIERDRQKALAEMERLKRDIQAQTKTIVDTAEEARKASVPPGWLR